jgi:hypothetical protein
VPQTSSSLERLNRKAVMVHVATPYPRNFCGRGKHEAVGRNVNSFTSVTILFFAFSLVLSFRAFPPSF